MIKLLQRSRAGMYYVPLSESRLDTWLLQHERGSDTDYAKLYQGLTLSYSKKHYWVRHKDDHFYLGLAPIVPDVLTYLMMGEFFTHKKKALVGQRIGTVGSQDTDLQIKAPFPISELQFNIKLMDDYRWLSHSADIIWVAKGKTNPEEFKRLLTPEEYNKRKHVIRWA